MAIFIHGGITGPGVILWTKTTIKWKEYMNQEFLRHWALGNEGQ